MYSKINYSPYYYLNSRHLNLLDFGLKIGGNKKTKRQIPTLQTRSRRSTIRKTTQHKQKMPPLRTHKQRVKSQNTQLEMSKMRKNT